MAFQCYREKVSTVRVSGGVIISNEIHNEHSIVLMCELL